jgi:hypothetical protein
MQEDTFDRDKFLEGQRFDRIIKSYGVKGKSKEALASKLKIYFKNLELRYVSNNRSLAK